MRGSGLLTVKRKPFSGRSTWTRTPCLLVLSLLVAQIARASTAPAVTQTAEEQVVAAVLMGEAWCQGRTGMLAVGEVIHQRALKQRKSPLQVVTAARRGVHAFSCLNGTSPQALVRRFQSAPEYATALDVARIVCREPSRLPGITLQATHYSRAVERPWWARGSRPVAVIGAHAFYRLSRI